MARISSFSLFLKDGAVFFSFFLGFYPLIELKETRAKGSGYCASVRTMTRVRGLRNSKILIGTKKKQKHFAYSLETTSKRTLERKREREGEKRKSGARKGEQEA